MKQFKEKHRRTIGDGQIITPRMKKLEELRKENTNSETKTKW
jgi:hypothetical protein